MQTLSRFAPKFITPAQTKPLYLPFGEWMPDQPALGNPGLVVAKNVIPRTKNSYGPFPSASAFSSALTAYCRGAFSARDNTGNVSNFAGDETTLYKSNGNGWDDVTRTSGGAYATAAKSWWDFANFGSVVIATNHADALQEFTLGSSSDFALLDSAAPKAKNLAIVKDFLMVGNTIDGTDADQPNRIWWSAINDPTNWPTPGTASAAQVQSDYQNLPDTGYVQRILPAIGGADAAVFCERGIWRVTYVGPPTIFNFDPVEGARGTPAPRSVIAVGPVAYYISENYGISMFNGAASIPVGDQRVNTWLRENLSLDNLHRVTAVASPDDPVVMWGFMSNDATTHPDKILLYNYQLDRFAYAELDHEVLRRATADGYTLEQLDNIDSNIETFPYSFDDPILTGGATVLSMFDTLHRAANLDGVALAAELETGEINTHGIRGYVDGLRPLVDNEDEVTAALKYRDSQETDPTATSYTGREDDGICYNRVESRYIRGSVMIEAGATWEHAQGLEAVQAGEGWR